MRGSLQTTFRTPSPDDVNESPLTTLEWINQTGAYQAVDRFGSKALKPEQALTYNVGLALVTEAGSEATFDYWSYDFRHVIGAIDSFVTWDVSFLWNVSRGVNIAFSGVNLLNARPPLVNIEQAYDGFTHDPKGRRLKLAVTYRLGR